MSSPRRCRGRSCASSRTGAGVRGSAPPQRGGNVLRATYPRRREPRPPRNAPCPCGSGRKYKRCCVDRERELARRDEAAGELLALGSLFPRLRPSDPAFERWAAEVAAPDPPPDLIREGAEHVSRADCERLVEAYAAESPDAWASLVAEFGDEHDAKTAVVVGGVAAALREAREPDPGVLDLLEEDADLAADPVEVLAIALEACDLWSVVEAADADTALAALPDVSEAAYEVLWAQTLAEAARRAWTDDHARRLAFLVERLRRALPVQSHPRASEALAQACDEFARDPAVRDTVAAALLGDATGPLRLLNLAA